MKYRDDTFEQITLNTLVYKFPNALHFDKYNSLINVQNKKEEVTNRPIIFQDIESPYPTFKGNPHVTEFGLYAPMHKIDARIECKSMSALSNMAKGVLDELQYVTELPEQLFCLVLGKELLNIMFKKALMERIKKFELQRRVWYGSVTELGQLIDKRKGCK